MSRLAAMAVTCGWMQRLASHVATPRNCHTRMRLQEIGMDGGSIDAVRGPLDQRDGAGVAHRTAARTRFHSLAELIGQPRSLLNKENGR